MHFRYSENSFRSFANLGISCTVIWNSERDHNGNSAVPGARAELRCTCVCTARVRVRVRVRVHVRVYVRVV